MTAATLAADRDSTASSMPMPIPPGREPAEFMEEVRLGFERLRAMPPDELRRVIASRVEMLERILKDREERRAALDTAQLASRLLEMRRARSRRIHRQVNIGSACAAALSTLLIVVSMV